MYEKTDAQKYGEIGGEKVQMAGPVLDRSENGCERVVSEQIGKLRAGGAEREICGRRERSRAGRVEPALWAERGQRERADRRKANARINLARGRRGMAILEAHGAPEQIQSIGVAAFR